MADKGISGFEWPSFRPPLEKYKLDYGIGIVGYAGIVRAQHLPAYRLAGYRVAAAADIKADRRELAKLDGIPHVYEDYRELLQRDDVQIIDCAVDHSMMDVRVAILKDAAKAGKAVLMQKPMATDLKTAEEMVKIAEDAGIPYAVNQNLQLRSGHLPDQAVPGTGALRQARLHTVRESLDRGSQVRLRPRRRRAGMADSRARLGALAVRRRGGLDLRHEPEQRLHVSNRVLQRGGLQLLRVSQRGHLPERDAAARMGGEGRRARQSPVESGLSLGEDLVEVRGYDWPKEIGWVTCGLPDDLTNRDVFVKPCYDMCGSIGGFIGSMGEFMQSLHEKRPALTNGRDNLMSLRIYFAGQLSAELKRPVDPRTMQPLK